MRLEQGLGYQAKVKLGFFEKITSNDTVKAKLTEAGFSQVLVVGSGSVRDVYGVWMGQDMDVDPASVDEHLYDVSRA